MCDVGEYAIVRINLDSVEAIQNSPEEFVELLLRALEYENVEHQEFEEPAAGEPKATLETGLRKCTPGTEIEFKGRRGAARVLFTAHVSELPVLVHFGHGGCVVHQLLPSGEIRSLRSPMWPTLVERVNGAIRVRR